MIITVDISMYPLDSDYKPPIKNFILRLREYDGLELVSNQLSTQVRGEFEMVTEALNACMRESMAMKKRVVFVARYLNADLDIASLPNIG